MKTVMKKMFSLLLVAALLVSAVPVAFADSTFTVDVEITGAKTASRTVQVKADGSETVGGVYEWVANQEGINTSVFTPSFSWAGAVTNGSVESGVAIGEDGTLTVALTAHSTHLWDEGVVTIQPTCTTQGRKVFTCACGETTEQYPDALGHNPGDAATCTEPQKCTRCGTELDEATDHTPGVDATCTAPKKCTVCQEVLVEALGHDYGDDGVCENGCGTRETDTHEVYFTVNNNQNYWHLGVKHGNTVANPGFQYATDYTYLERVGDTETKKFMGWSTNPNATSGNDLDVIVQLPVNAQTIYYAIYQNKETSSGSTGTGTGTGTGNTGSNNTTSGSTSNIPSGSHNLYVRARIYIGSTYEKTIQMDTKATGISGDAKIVDVMATLRSALNEEIKSSKFSEYHGLDWDTQDYYYKVDDGEYKAISNRMTVSDDNYVYINLYSAEKLVVVNVHTSKSYHTDLSVRIRGKRIGDTVTYDDVKDAVKKYYSVNSLSIYEYDEWCDVVEGGSGKKTYDFTVEGGDNIYEAYISGSRKSGTYTYTADSSNPKTGDAIFAPMMILGASASALAVLFYLNKKRAY